MGGSGRPPSPPTLGPAPAKPWRSSILRQAPSLAYAIDVLHPRARERSCLAEANAPDPRLGFHAHEKEAASPFQ
jgi:hypothetical protein